MAAENRILIAGVAPIASMGIGRGDFSQGIAEGREGIHEVQSFNPAAYDYGLAAECLDFALEDYLDSEKTYIDRCSELTLAACALALEDAGIEVGDVSPEGVGLVLGTAYGPLDSMSAHTQRVQKGGLRRASSMLFLHSFVNTPISLASIEFDIRGPVTCFCSGMASSGAALQFARDLVADGRSELALSGGVDALSEVLYAALNEEGRLGPEFVPGEGAALLALQSEATLEARGATALGELLSVGLATDPANPWSAAWAAEEQALGEAGLDRGDVRVLTPPDQYGKPFGATFAMHICAAVCQEWPDGPVLISERDPAGPACAAIVGKP